MSRARNSIFHFIGWALFYMLIAAFISSSSMNAFPILVTPTFLAFQLVYVGLFYFNTRVLMPELYLKQKYVTYFLTILLLLVAVMLLKPFDRVVTLGNHSSYGFDINRSAPPPGGPLGPPPDGNFPRRKQGLDIVSIVLFIAIWAASSVLHIARQWRNTERRAIQAEAGKAAAELSFLKAQINPHFLFNTLNNIYALATVKSEHTPNAILKLSGILRYVTDDVAQDFVPLQSEVDCVSDYIELQKLRLSKKVQVQFSVEGDTNGKQVMPLLFMTFIENAFKYGISNREDCTILIKLHIHEHKIVFFCENNIMRQDDSERVGIGITNAKKRLAYLYPEKYLLRINNNGTLFTVDLTLLT